jgi:aminoglycoside/choline kinase family phosphotransferase
MTASSHLVSGASPSCVLWADAQRETAFQAWIAPLAVQFGLDLATLRLASADASFRRYLRISGSSGAAGVAGQERGAGPRSVIVMDAPPDREAVAPFLDIAQRMQEADLPGPRVLAADAAQGFLLLTDLGDQTLLPWLQAAAPESADQRMRQVASLLVDWQTRMRPVGLPVFDEALLQRELDLFPEWCVRVHYGVEWTAQQHEWWRRVCRALIDSALAQPTVVVHRDWMPRNLMRTADDGLAILDFQDAVCGPITYDVASMLRDAFHSWDEAQEVDWAVRHWQAARKAGLPVDDDFGAHWRALEWMGLQRHLKVLGIFCRLKHRDHKPRYAEDLPRFFAYATKVAMRYRELGPLMPLIEPLSGIHVPTGFSMR